MNKYLIIIAGPTAIGKTKLCIDLAKHFDAEIFSCDSRQIFKEMSIGTAKPSTEEQSGIKHHFIDEISVNQSYNVGQYLRDFDTRLQEYFSNNDIAIVTGGTGLYIKAILEGINEFPEVAPEILDKVEAMELPELQGKLLELDPEYASIVDLDNPMRLIRAVSVIMSSGKKFSTLLAEQIQRKLYFKPIKIVLERDREELYDRINRRVDIMLDSGLIEEVKSLSDYQSNKALATVGYTEIFKYLDGTIDLEEAIRLIKRNSRRYAKRQMTWFRNQDHFTPFHPEKIDSIIRFIEAEI